MNYSATVTVSDVDDGTVDVSVDFGETGLKPESSAHSAISRMVTLWLNEQDSLRDAEGE
jgi:hypothetical protein